MNQTFHAHPSNPVALVGLASTPPPALKGRAVTWMVAHRFESLARQPEADGWEHVESSHGEPASPLASPVTVMHEQVRSILSSNQSPDIGFDLSINPYRGCEHACIYCYARPTHSYLDLSPGQDFETRIVAKDNAAQVLRQSLASAAYEPAVLNIGSVTDPYQPIERKLRITRSILEVMQETRHAFSMLTKASLIERDLDVLGEMGRQGLFAAYVSIPTLEPSLARVMEPRATAPARRLRTLEALARAGIPVGVSVSPIIPFLNEPEIETILQQAANAGATRAFSVVLRLPWEVNPMFQTWLQQHFPQRAGRVMARVREMRGGKDNDAQFKTRMTGQGVWAQLVRQRFDKACARHGLNRQRFELDLSQFVRPAKPHAVLPHGVSQGCLF
jgi:DNA repair photolyase